MAKHYDQRRAPAPSHAAAPPPVAVVEPETPPLAEPEPEPEPEPELVAPPPVAPIAPSDDEITRRDRPARTVRGVLPFLEPGCRSYAVLSGRICKNSVVYGDGCENNVIALDDVQAARFQGSVALLD